MPGSDIIEFTNFQPAPASASYAQGGKWSIPLSREESKDIPQKSKDAIRSFVSVFLPEFLDVEFSSTKLCWYTDTLDNSFLIDYVPTYADHSVFVATGGSGHGAKFMPVLGQVSKTPSSRGTFDRNIACAGKAIILHLTRFFCS